MDSISALRDKIKLMDADRAIAVITDFIAANPDSADAYVTRGLKYFGRGDRALAINDFLKASKSSRIPSPPRRPSTPPIPYSTSTTRTSSILDSSHFSFYLSSSPSRSVLEHSSNLPRRLFLSRP